MILVAECRAAVGAAFGSGALIMTAGRPRGDRCIGARSRDERGSLHRDGDRSRTARSVNTAWAGPGLLLLPAAEEAADRVGDLRGLLRQRLGHVADALAHRADQ
jgi:hypothetical protein